MIELKQILRLVVGGENTMFRHRSCLFTGALAALGMALTAGAQPSMNVARIPVGADLASIRFQGVKMAGVPAGYRSSTDDDYCQAAALRVPGGTAVWPLAQPEALTRVYQVTYSFNSQPLPSDESGSRDFTFSVYFRPDELDPAVREAFSHKRHKRMGRADAAGFFELSASQELQATAVIDQVDSTFCNGSYVDGEWVHTDPECEDNPKFKTIAAPTGYILVRVEPASPRRTTSAALVQRASKHSEERRNAELK